MKRVRATPLPKRLKPQSYEPNPDYTVDLMLDSGVFSAWNRGEVLDIRPYIDYIKRHHHLLFSYVNMDVVPSASDASGAPPTYKETERSASESYKNLQIMKDAGLHPIPVFHQGERFYWLEKMLADGEPYIGISTWKARIRVADQQRWLDQVWSILSDAKGRPVAKTHGFGITNPHFLVRYPWFTVDSTTWSLSPGYGNILVPVYVDGKPDYSRPPIKVVLSGVVQQNASAQKRQFELLGPVAQETVRTFLEQEVGISVTEARYGTTSRRRAMLVYYKGLTKALRDVRFRHATSTLNHTANAYAPKTALPAWNLTLMFATCLNREWSALMKELDCRTRLLSYYELRNKSTEILEDYVMRGHDGTEYVQRPVRQKYTSEAYLNRRRLALAKRLEKEFNELGELKT